MLSLRPMNKALAGVALALALTVASLLPIDPWPEPAGAQSPEITIELSTNGSDADVAPGPTLTPGESVTWQYLVAVNGPTTLYDLIVSDSSGATPNCDINADGGLDGTYIHPGPLKAGQSFTCSITGLAQGPGGKTFSSTASVLAFDFDGIVRFEDTDASFYTSKQQFIANPSVTIQSLVNGVDADASPGPYVEEGSAITWSYIVTNTGNTPLAAVTVTAPGEFAVDCGTGSNVLAGNLAPGAAVTCSGNSPAATFEAGAQATTGSVAANAIDPGSGVAIRQLSAQDPHAYTPVRMPGVLAFTGPSDMIAPAGMALTGLGLGLLAVGRALSRRRRGVTTGLTAR